MIVKIDDDTVQLTDTIVVKISELRDRLINIQNGNALSIELSQWRDSLPPDRQQYVFVPPLLITEEQSLIDQINTYENL